VRRRDVRCRSYGGSCARAVPSSGCLRHSASTFHEIGFWGVRTVMRARSNKVWSTRISATRLMIHSSYEKPEDAANDVLVEGCGCCRAGRASSARAACLQNHSRGFVTIRWASFVYGHCCAGDVVSDFPAAGVKHQTQRAAITGHAKIHQSFPTALATGTCIATVLCCLKTTVHHPSHPLLLEMCMHNFDALHPARAA
jgi:hypothetical protein